MTPFNSQRFSVCSNSFFSLSATKYASKKKTKIGTKARKNRSLYQKIYDSIHSALNARLKTSNKKHLIDLALNSPLIKLSQSENIILDNRDASESMVDFVKLIMQLVNVFTKFCCKNLKKFKPILISCKKI